MSTGSEDNSYNANNMTEFGRRVDAIRSRVSDLKKIENSDSHEGPAYSALQELLVALEELQVADEELRQQASALEEAQVILQQERQHYADLFEFAPDGYLLTNLEGIIKEVNQAALTLLNLDKSFLIGKPMAIFFYGEARHELRQKLIFLKQDERLQEWETLLYPRNRDAFYASMHAVTARDSQGRPFTIRWLFHDITDRKMVEAELEARVNERTAQLEAEQQEKEAAFQREKAARAEAEKISKLKTNFLAMVSHELRTPLTSIKGFSSTLLADDVNWDRKSEREFIQIIDEESDKLMDLIDQLLDLSRMQAGTIRVNVSQIAVKDIFVIAAAQLATLTQNHELIIDAPEGLDLLADPQRVAQVLVNLVSNAARYSPPETQITISVAREGPQVHFRVSDQGPGIPPEKRGRLFEPFQQAEREPRLQKGTGLGLAICKGLVEAMNGQIWIDESRGPGAVLSFTLPAGS